jgi:hypothetical protein
MRYGSARLALLDEAQCRSKRQGPHRDLIDCFMAQEAAHNLRFSPCVLDA